MTDGRRPNVCNIIKTRLKHHQYSLYICSFCSNINQTAASWRMAPPDWLTRSAKWCLVIHLIHSPFWAWALLARVCVCVCAFSAPREKKVTFWRKPIFFLFRENYEIVQLAGTRQSGHRRGVLQRGLFSRLVFEKIAPGQMRQLLPQTTGKRDGSSRSTRTTLALSCSNRASGTRWRGSRLRPMPSSTPARPVSPLSPTRARISSFNSLCNISKRLTAAVATSK